MRSSPVKYVVLTCSLTLLASSIAAGPVQYPIAGFAINLNLTNFETGVARPLPESFATVTSGCNFDDWQKTVNWGDGNTETLTHTVQATLPGPATPAGTYPVYSAHSYARAGTYTAIAQLIVHCVGAPAGPGGIVDRKSYSITVYDRLPLQTLAVSPGLVKRGGSVSVTAQTFADAPASGTRVDLTANKANVFGNGSLSVHSDIPTNSKTTTVTLTVSSTAPLGAVTITATAGSQLTKTITIAP
jgi:hypothetical protein